MKITDVSIENRTSIFILSFIIVLVGISAYSSLPREAAPDISIPFVIVSTPYFGVSPEDIESLITQPIEKEINAIPEVEKITSASYEGYSLIQAEFQSGYDIDEALQKVRDKVEKAEPDLPEDAETPEIIEINFSEFPIVVFNISGPQGLVKLKDIAEEIKDEIENIEGVLEVKINGGLEREVKVNVDLNKLIHYNIRFDDVINAIRDENKTIPGGSIDVNNSSFLVRVPGEFDKPFIIDDLIVKSEDNEPIYVSDIGEVEYSFKDRTTYSRLNGQDVISVQVSKRIGANIIEIADKVKDLIREYEKDLPAEINFTVSVDQSDDIRESVRNLENNIFSGLVLVILVLLFFLGVRNAFFVAIAIPLSMLITFVILSLLGITLNFIVLYALILALGMLVDNAIVIIENIYKFLEEGYSLIEAAKLGAKEVAWPISTSTLTTVTAFAPLLFWPGIVGDFMQYLPLTVIIVLTSSLFVALVINPVFASIFMKIQQVDSKPTSLFGKIAAPINKITYYSDTVLLPKTLDRYGSILTGAIGAERNPEQPVNKRNLFGVPAVILLLILTFVGVSIPALPNVIVIVLSVILGVAVIYIFTSPKLRVLAGAVLMLIIIILVFREFDHGVEFFPETDPPRIYINVEAPTGSNIDMSNKIAKRIEQKLTPFLDGEVTEYIANVGSSNNPFDGGSSTPNKSTITVQFKDYDLRDQSSAKTMEEIRRVVADVPGAEIEVEKEEQGPPVGFPVNIEISGENFSILGDLAKKVKEEIRNVDGLVDLKDNYDDGRPEIRVVINREKAALYGMNTALIANTVRTAINGFTASKYRILDEEYDITVRLKESQRESVDALRNMRINYNDKKGNTLSVPLTSVAEIVYDKGPGAIRRKDLDRVVTITANVGADYNENEVLQNVQKELSDFILPPDYKIEYTGQNEEQAEAAAFLSQAFSLALLSIFLILVIQFNSLSQPLIIMAAVVISLIGVFIGLIVFAMPFGIVMTGLGVISLAGVVVNNNIVLIDYINILRRRDISAREAAIRAGIRRFRPVTLTAITTILGLIPLTFGFGFDIYTFSITGGGTDAAFWRSMGIAVIFGLLFGTVLTLIIVPVIYTTIEDTAERVKVVWRKRKNKN